MPSSSSDPPKIDQARADDEEDRKREAANRRPDEPVDPDYEAVAALMAPPAAGEGKDLDSSRVLLAATLLAGGLVLSNMRAFQMWRNRRAKYGPHQHASAQPLHAAWAQRRACAAAEEASTPRRSSAHSTSSWTSAGGRRARAGATARAGGSASGTASTASGTTSTESAARTPHARMRGLAWLRPFVEPRWPTG